MLVNKQINKQRNDSQFYHIKVKMTIGMVLSTT